MPQKDLKFASVFEAMQYLSNFSNSKIIISKLQPDAGDYVILLNPRTDHYHVLQYPGSNIKYFSKDDIVKDYRSKGQAGQPLTFSSNMNPQQVAKEVADMLAGLSVENRKKMQAEDMQGIYMADSLASDRSSDISSISNIDFVTDRSYTGIGSIGTLKSKKDIEAEKQRRLKQIKKAPTRYKKKVKKEEFDPYAGDVGYSKKDIQKMFSSSDEAFQYLSDITGKKIIIN